MSLSCIYREVTCRCHVSEICDIFVKDETKYVCVEMIYACRKCGESHMVGFLVCVLMIYACRKCSKRHMVIFLQVYLCMQCSTTKQSDTRRDFLMMFKSQVVH